jgi:hypothetical protein
MPDYDTHPSRRLPALVAVLFLLGAGLVSCAPMGAPPDLDPASLSLLRLEYHERAARLPTMNIDRVELPQVDYLGRFSPLLWMIRSESLPRRELLRPLPYEDVDLRLRDTFSRTLEEFGFTMRGWPGRPSLRLRVDVERLLLLSENGDSDRRSCEITLLLRIQENPSGLEVTRFRCKARSDLPGSWTALREGHAQWTPRIGEPDPIEAAVAVAARQFLVQSLEFWREPDNWREGSIGFSSAAP